MNIRKLTQHWRQGTVCYPGSLVLTARQWLDIAGIVILKHINLNKKSIVKKQKPLNVYWS
jgi:hypothetical protein